MTPNAYPLQWPPGWPRSPRQERGPYKTSLAGALANLRDEVRRLGGSNLVLSSNVTLGSESPKDPGVAAYFTYDKEPTCIPCDRWTTVAANVQAISLTIDAMRAIERHGAKHMVKAAFRGFQALPAPGRSWRDVLGFHPGTYVTERDVEEAFKRLAQERHPDKGGSTEAMAELNIARQQALLAGS